MIGFSDVRGILKKTAAEALVVVALVAVVIYFAVWVPAWATQAVVDRDQSEDISALKSHVEQDHANDRKLDEILKRLPER